MRFSILVALASCLVAACTGTTDWGQTCKMTYPTDAGPVEIEEGKVANALVDYISFGSAECDDMVCLRTARSKNPANESGKARGYCSPPCIDSAGCEPDYQGNMGAMVCDQLLLEQSFLDELKRTDPTTYQKLFGDSVSAKYCVLPRAKQ